MKAIDQLYQGDKTALSYPRKRATETGRPGGGREDARNVNQFTVDIDNVNSRQVLRYNLNRKYLLVENRTGNAIYLSFDTRASADEGIEIAAGGLYEREIAVPKGSVWLFGDAASQEIQITEGF